MDFRVKSREEKTTSSERTRNGKLKQERKMNSNKASRIWLAGFPNRQAG